MSQVIIYCFCFVRVCGETSHHNILVSSTRPVMVSYYLGHTNTRSLLLGPGILPTFIRISVFIIYLPYILPILPRYFTIKSAPTDFTICKICSRITSSVCKSVRIHTRNAITLICWCRASHSFDPDRDSSESGFLDLITISITPLYL